MLRIVDALECNDIRNSGCHFHGESPNHRWTKLSAPRRDLSHPFFRMQLSRAKKARPKGCESFTPTNPRRTLRIPNSLINDKDIVNFHFLGGQIWDQVRLLESIPKQCRIVITMHDMHQVTGGCHYSNGCEKYKSRCDSCPQLPGRFGDWICESSFKEKQQIFMDREITLITPSTWLEQVTQESAIGKSANRIVKIGYPFPEMPAPIPREEARKKLNLASTKEKLILLVAEDLNNRRKGTYLLLEGLKMNRLPGCRILLLGKEIEIDDPRVQQLGYIADPVRLRSAYAAADLLCLPSIEENLAQTGMESLAEGTPVVCFAGTGPADYVIQNETGLQADRKDPDELAETILRALNQESLSNQDSVIKAYSTLYSTFYSKTKVKDLYRNLYTSILEKSER